MIALPDVGQHGSVVEDRDGGLGVKKDPLLKTAMDWESRRIHCGRHRLVEDSDGLGVKKDPLWEAPAWCGTM
jgi:hypothetical protein